MPASLPKDRAFRRLVTPEDFQRLRNTGTPASNRFTRAQHAGELASNTTSRTETREPAPSKSISTSKPEAPSTPSSAERTRFDHTRESSSSSKRPGRIREPASNESSSTSRPKAPSAPASAYHARSTQTSRPASPRTERPQRPSISSTPATPSRLEPTARPIPYEKLHRPELITPETAYNQPGNPVQRIAEPVSERRTRPRFRQPPNSAPRRILKPGCPFVPPALEEPAQSRKEVMLAVHRSNIRRMKENIQQLKRLLGMEKKSVETKQLQLRRCTDKRQIPGLQEEVGASEKKVCGFEREMEALLALIEDEQEKCDWVWWDEGSRGSHGEMQKLQEVEAKRVWDEGDGVLVTESVLG